MPEIRGSFRSFDAAERFFRDKVNLPTNRWDDLHQGQHARAFVVAGATKDALLTDLREAVDAAITQGETLDDFRKRFDDLAKRNGWVGFTGDGTPGGRAWRTATIYHTNIRTAYAAGRWETLRKFPYLRYKHNTRLNPREQHQAWNGKIVATNDPWWQTHYPPNGWGCRCEAFGVSAAKLRADGLKPDQAPPSIPGDPPTEWAYNVGEADIGRLLSDQDMQLWRDRKADAWEVLTPTGPAEFNRPDRVPLDSLPRPLADVRKVSPEELTAMIRDALGGEERVFELPVTGTFTHRIVASASVLAQHVDSARARVVPLLPDVLTDPFEVWQSFERHKGTGRVVLRTRYVRAFDMPGLQGMLVVVEAVKGQLLGWTLIPARLGYIERQRYGNLLYGR